MELSVVDIVNQGVARFYCACQYSYGRECRSQALATTKESHHGATDPCEYFKSRYSCNEHQTNVKNTCVLFQFGNVWSVRNPRQTLLCHTFPMFFPGKTHPPLGFVDFWGITRQRRLRVDPMQGVTWLVFFWLVKWALRVHGMACWKSSNRSRQCPLQVDTRLRLMWVFWFF